MTRNELIFSDEWLSVTIENTVRSDRAIKAIRDELLSQLSKMRDEWVDAAREDEAGKYADIKRLLSYLAEFGGSIVSTNSLQPEWIMQAQASGRIYVDENSLGYVWEPDTKRLPETPEELEFFERWFPLKVELPKELGNLDWLHKQKQSIIDIMNDDAKDGLYNDKNEKL